MTAIQLGLLAGEPRQSQVLAPEDFAVDDIDSSVFTTSNTGDSTAKLPTSALVIISSYIPAEALGFYVTATALLRYPYGRGDAIIAGCAIVFVILLVLVANTRIPHNERSKRRLALALSFAVLAACAYISALPQSFVHEWQPYTSTVGAVVLLGASILLPVLGDLFRFMPIVRGR
jgi:hypothetical protein